VLYPGWKARAWDVEGGRRFPLASVSLNGRLISKEEFLEMICLNSKVCGTKLGRDQQSKESREIKTK